MIIVGSAGKVRAPAHPPPSWEFHHLSPPSNKNGKASVPPLHAMPKAAMPLGALKGGLKVMMEMEGGKKEGRGEKGGGVGREPPPPPPPPPEERIGTAEIERQKQMGGRLC